MKINIETNERFKAFINVAGNTQDSDAKDHNELVNKFISLVNSGELSIHAFTGKDDKIIIGFK